LRKKARWCYSSHNSSFNWLMKHLPGVRFGEVF
jgi:hypothetical protein